MDLSAAWQAYSPVRDLLDLHFCFRQAATLKLHCPPALSTASLKAQVTKGYPAVFTSSGRFRITRNAGDFQGKISSMGLLKLSGEIKQETAPVQVRFRMERLLVLAENWGKCSVSCVYPGAYAQVTAGLSSSPSLFLSVTTPKAKLRLAADVEVSLRQLELQQYHATLTWQGARHFLSIMHESTRAFPTLGNLHLGYIWNCSNHLTVGSELLYLSNANVPVSTVGVAWNLGQRTLKAKLNSEGFVSLSVHVPISSFELTISTHFDARNLHSSTPREAHFGFTLCLSP